MSDRFLDFARNDKKDFVTSRDLLTAKRHTGRNKIVTKLSLQKSPTGSRFLTFDLEPGENAEVEFTVRLPKAPGSYILEFDMVAEHITWFEDHGLGLSVIQLPWSKGVCRRALVISG